MAVPVAVARSRPMYRGSSRRQDGCIPPPGAPRVSAELRSGRKKRGELAARREEARRHEEQNRGGDGAGLQDLDDAEGQGDSEGDAASAGAGTAQLVARPETSAAGGGGGGAPPAGRVPELHPASSQAPASSTGRSHAAEILRSVGACRGRLPGVASEAEWGSALRAAARCCRALTDLSLEQASESGASLAVFEMVQQCMQSGPLKGGKPGYFKRCGPGVAATACEFLSGLPDPVSGLMFTERQQAILAKWIKDSSRAAAKGG